MKAMTWAGLGVVLAVVGLLAGCGSQGSSQDTQALQSQVSQLSTQVDELSGQVKALQDQLKTAPGGGDVSQQLEALKSQLAALQSGGGGDATGAGSLRIAFVNAEEVFVKFQGTQSAVKKYSDEKKAKEEELQTLKDQWSAGTISQQEYQTQLNQLQGELQTLDQKLTTDITQKILDTIQELGAESDYDLITGRKNVILYYKEGHNIVDITDQVLERMNEKYNSSDSSGGS